MASGCPGYGFVASVVHCRFTGIGLLNTGEWGILVRVVVHNGIRHALSSPAGFIPTRFEFGLRRPTYSLTLLCDIGEA